jgi:hypothetical protein
MCANKAEGAWYAHAHAMSIASSLLMHAKREDQRYQQSISATGASESRPELHPFQARVACITYVAFALEGYLHLVGQLEYEKHQEKEAPLCTCLDCWDRKPTKEKLKSVCKKFGVKLDLGKEPHDIIVRLIDFRDTQAHPKLIRVSDADDSRSPEAIFDDATIFMHINPDEADMVHEQVRELVHQIERSRPGGNPDTWVKISELSGSISS